MADINSVVAKTLDALTEAQTVAGVPTDAAQITALQGQVTQLTADKTALQTKYDGYVSAVRAAAQADKDADDAKESGQGVIDVPA